MASNPGLIQEKQTKILAYFKELLKWFISTNVHTQSSKRVKTGLAIVFALAWVYYALHAFFAHRMLSPWTTGEWLINYGGGFQRRGALGTITLALSDLTSLTPTFVAFVSQSVIAAVGIFLMFKLLTTRDCPLSLFMVLAGPMGFLYFLTDLAVVGRKEIILYLLTLLWILYLKSPSVTRREKSTNNLLLFAFALMFTFAILSHEGFVFFIPILVWVTLASDIQGLVWTPRLMLRKTSPLLSAVLVSIPPLILATDDSVGSGICEAVTTRGEETSICSGAIALASGAAIENLFFSTVQDNLWPWLMAYLPIALILFILTFAFSDSYMRSVNLFQFKVNTNWSIAGLFALSSPIFIVSVDWGRYLSMFFTISSIGLLGLYQSRKKIAITSQAPTPHRSTSSRLVRRHGAAFITAYFLFFGVSHIGGSYQPLTVSFLNQSGRMLEILATILF
jgi:hypothetical protein